MVACLLTSLGSVPAVLPARAPARQRASTRRRVALAPAAIALFPESAGRSQTQEIPAGRILPLLSDYVQARASVTRFERLAGRTAMVGAAVALATEAALPSSGGLFGGAAESGLAVQYAALLGFLLCCAAGMAARLQGRAGAFSSRRLLEPTIASLTSKRRSFAGVTQINVDRALDSALDTVLDPLILKAFVAEEDQYI